MQKYKYTAVNLQNQRFKGVFIAKDEKDLASQLARQGLYLTSSAPYKGDVSFFTLGSAKVSMNELTTFCRQFAIMIDTGIPILDCLDILRNQQYGSFLKKLLQIVYEDVKGGMLLSAALEKHPKTFPNFFRSMIHVGETSGKLETVLNSLADYYEKDAAIKRKVKSAMSYPLMLMGMTVGIVIIMMLMVIPTFRDAMSSLEVNPEGLTKTVYDMSDYLIANWMYMLIGLLCIVAVIFLLLRLEKGKYIKDVLLVKLPLINTVQKNLIAARFSRAFGLLLSSGMDLNEAMISVEVILTNRYVKKKFRAAAENIRHGMSMTVALENEKLFPQMMIQMVSIGEKTATLDSVFAKSCEFFDVQVETSLTSLTSKIQPAMMLIMGTIIATLFIAVYSPMLTIMTGLGASSI